MSDEPRTMSVSTLVKERAFEENARRHFPDKRQTLVDALVGNLTQAGYLHETLEPTGKPNEFIMSLTIRAVK